MNKMTIANVEMKVVAPIPAFELDRLVDIVEAFTSVEHEEKGFQAIQGKVKEIASGYCGRVYDLGENYILKINKPWVSYNTRDGKILEALQACPMTPNIYMYDEENRFMVIEKIHGQTAKNYSRNPEFALPQTFDFEKMYEWVYKCADQINELGWNIGDAHTENCMIDREGRFYIVDVGLFSHHSESEWGRGVGSAIESLREINNAHEEYETRKQHQFLMEQQNMWREAVEVNFPRMEPLDATPEPVKNSSTMDLLRELLGLAPLNEVAVANMSTFSTDYYNQSTPSDRSCCDFPSFLCTCDEHTSYNPSRTAKYGRYIDSCGNTVSKKRSGNKCRHCSYYTCVGTVCWNCVMDGKY